MILRFLLICCVGGALSQESHGNRDFQYTFYNIGRNRMRFFRSALPDLNVESARASPPRNDAIGRPQRTLNNFATGPPYGPVGIQSNTLGGSSEEEFLSRYSGGSSGFSPPRLNPRDANRGPGNPRLTSSILNTQMAGFGGGGIGDGRVTSGSNPSGPYGGPYGFGPPASGLAARQNSPSSPGGPFRNYLGGNYPGGLIGPPPSGAEFSQNSPFNRQAGPGSGFGSATYRVPTGASPSRFRGGPSNNPYDSRGESIGAPDDYGHFAGLNGPGSSYGPGPGFGGPASRLRNSFSTRTASSSLNAEASSRLLEANRPGPRGFLNQPRPGSPSSEFSKRVTPGQTTRGVQSSLGPAELAGVRGPGPYGPQSGPGPNNPPPYIGGLNSGPTDGYGFGPSGGLLERGLLSRQGRQSRGHPGPPRGTGAPPSLGPTGVAGVRGSYGPPPGGPGPSNQPPYIGGLNFGDGYGSSGSPYERSPPGRQNRQSRGPANENEQFRGDYLSGAPNPQQQNSISYTPFTPRREIPEFASIYNGQYSPESINNFGREPAYGSYAGRQAGGPQGNLYQNSFSGPMNPYGGGGPGTNPYESRLSGGGPIGPWNSPGASTRNPELGGRPRPYGSGVSLSRQHRDSTADTQPRTYSYPSYRMGLVAQSSSDSGSVAEQPNGGSPTKATKREGLEIKEFSVAERIDTPTKPEGEASILDSAPNKKVKV